MIELGFIHNLPLANMKISGRPDWEPIRCIYWFTEPFSLFIVRPHSDNFHRLDVVKNLVDQAVLYVDSSGIGAGEISHKLFIWRGIPVRVFL